MKEFIRCLFHNKKPTIYAEQKIELIYFVLCCLEIYIKHGRTNMEINVENQYIAFLLYISILVFNEFRSQNVGNNLQMYTAAKHGHKTEVDFFMTSFRIRQIPFLNHPN